MADDSLAGCRVLVVEDEMLIALEIEEILQALGCIVVGPIGKLDAALQSAREETLDAAVLDVTIRGGHVYPVAEQLLARGVPFVLASGYGDRALPESLRDRPRLTKPFTQHDVEKHVRSLCRGDGEGERALSTAPELDTVSRDSLQAADQNITAAKSDGE